MNTKINTIKGITQQKFTFLELLQYTVLGSYYFR